jgi:hypothetical protein
MGGWSGYRFIQGLGGSSGKISVVGSKIFFSSPDPACLKKYIDFTNVFSRPKIGYIP